MAVNERARNLAKGGAVTVRSDFNSEINTSAVKAKLSASECSALVGTIRSTEGWFAQQAGDLHHRYVFCWRWKEPQTAVLFCWDERSWLELRKRIEKALGIQPRA